MCLLRQRLPFRVGTQPAVLPSSGLLSSPLGRTFSACGGNLVCKSALRQKPLKKKRAWPEEAIASLTIIKRQQRAARAPECHRRIAWRHSIDAARVRALSPHERKILKVRMSVKVS